MIETFMTEFPYVFSNAIYSIISNSLFLIAVTSILISFSLAMSNEKHAMRLNAMFDHFCEAYENVPVLGICGLVPLFLRMFTFSTENTVIYIVFASKKMFRFTANGITRPIERFVTSYNIASLPSFGPIMMTGSASGYEPEIVIYKTGGTSKESDDDPDSETILYQLDQTSQQVQKDAGKRTRLLALLAKLENLENGFTEKIESFEERIAEKEAELKRWKL